MQEDDGEVGTRPAADRADIFPANGRSPTEGVGRLAIPQPCPAALGMVGVPARRWRTKADLYGQLAEAKAFMDCCPLERVTLAECAERAGMSIHHFLRLFHEVYGVTPLKYLGLRRVFKAKELLKDTGLSVSEIALEVGLGSASSFGRMFRRVEGCSPSAYRSHFARSVERRAGRSLYHSSI